VKTDNCFRYIPALDGLRAIAVTLVIGYHGAGPALGWLTRQFNGWAGVDLFFVLSGYLITSLLIQEQEDFGSFSLKAFYVRRCLRIMPAFYTFLAVMFVWYGPSASSAIGITAIYLSDYDLALGWNVLSDGWRVSGLMLGHTWSLAIEEQFYVIWPAFLFVTGRRALPVAVMALIGILIWRGYLIASADVAHARVYHAFDTRFDTILIGCLAALLWSCRATGDRVRSFLSWPWAPLVLVAALVVSMKWLELVKTGPINERLVFWLVQMPLNAVLCALFIVSLRLSPDSIVTRVLSTRLLIWLGKLSYSLYLWHVFGIHCGRQLEPILDMCVPKGSSHETVVSVLMELFGFVFCLIFACASYYFVERPFLRLKHQWERSREEKRRGKSVEIQSPQ
jgi:peptidoglycan/LPS O-acetylase OafA/YrhL